MLTSFKIFSFPPKKEEQTDPCCLLALLNAFIRPGAIQAVAVGAARDAFGGKLACRLAIDAFQREIVKCSRQPDDGQINFHILKEAVREANIAVFEFSEKLSAHNKMLASMGALSILNGSLVALHVGKSTISICRRGGDFEDLFTHSQSHKKEALSDFGQLLGEDRKVLAQAVQLELAPHDVILISPKLIDKKWLNELGNKLKEAQMGPDLESSLRSLEKPEGFAGVGLILIIVGEDVYHLEPQAIVNE